MGASREEIEKALEWAKGQNDEAAITGLNDLLGKQPALPDNYVPGEASEKIASESDPIPSLDMGALPEPSTDAEIDQAIERRQAGPALAAPQAGPALAAPQAGPALAAPQPAPWGDKTKDLFDRIGDVKDTKEKAGWEKAQTQYDADQELMADPANMPSDEEAAGWIKMQQPSMNIPGAPAMLPIKAPYIKAEGKQVLRDPQTGKLRWSAMSPEQIYKDEKTSFGGALMGAVTSESIRLVGNRVDAIEVEQDAIEIMQRHVFSSLSTPEKERVRGELARKYDVDPSKITDELIATKIPPHALKEAVDQNEGNSVIYDEAYAGESGIGERLRRLTTKTTRAAARALTFGEDDEVAVELFGMTAEGNPGGAENPLGPVFGKDSPFAHFMEAWQDKARNEDPTYSDMASRFFIEPFKAFDPDLQLGQAIKVGAEKVKEHAYGEYYDRAKKPLLKPGSTFDDWLEAETYTSDEASINDPAAVILKIAEQIPNMAPALITSRLSGGLAARMFQGGIRGRGALEQTIKQLEKLSRQRSMAGGVFGNFLANSIVYDQAASEVRDTIRQVPDERMMMNPEIRAMMDAHGLTLEEASWLMMAESSGRAGRNAYAVSSLITAPSSALTGMGGAGTLLNRNAGLRVAAALTLSPAEEGVQEVLEGGQTDLQIERIDPENPILKDEGRFFERLAGGVVTGLGMATPEAVMAVEPRVPVGIDENTAAAARTTEEFMKARNARFAQELKVTDPNYIARTSAIKRLEQLEKLESLQVTEAKSILEMAPPTRKYMKENPAQGREADLAMLNSLEMFANSQLTDIAVAKNQRMTARQMLENHEALFEERKALQRRVNDKLIDLDDIKRQMDTLTQAQEQQPMSNQDMAEMIEEGFIVTVGESDRPIITAKGRRALKNLGRQRLNMEAALHQGFSDKERRTPQSLARRDQIDKMAPEDKERLLYKDPATNVPNNRAFKERGQDAPAYATVEVDSVEWVNDNMNYAAGDRLLSDIAGSIDDAIKKAAAEGLFELGDDDKGVELYRTGGKEFVVTGPSEEIIETVMRNAATAMTQQRVTDGRTDVIPTVTWGKGTSQKASEKDALAARTKRINDGKVGDRKAPHARASTKKKGLFNLDDDLRFAGAVLKHDERSGGRAMIGGAPFHMDQESRTEQQRLDDDALLDAEIDYGYEDLRDIDVARSYKELTQPIAVGDIVELLTPMHATFGTVTAVKGDTKRPRIEVTADGRRFRFNPDKNWLINHPMSSPEDIAWITSDLSMLDADNIPQVMEEVQLGLMGTGGDNWYADLSTPLVTEQQSVSEFMTTQFSPSKQNLPIATPEQESRSEEIKAKLFNGFENLPDITLVHDINTFRAKEGDLYNQILAEVRAAGGVSLRGVKGYFDHNNPRAGVYVFTANIGTGSVMDGNRFEEGIMETIFHEVIGHYGIRGIFKNEYALRRAMFELVDTFPDLAKRMAAQLNLYGANKKTGFDPARKQLLGEEMLAYVVGLEMSGQLDVTPEQKGVIRKIIDWMKQWLNRFFGAHTDRFVTTGKMQAEFWNDERIQELIVMSTDFARRGPPYRFEQIANGLHIAPMMRDGDIFQWGIQQIFRTATRKLSGNDRKQLKQKYGGLENVPKEVPLFPPEGTLNAYQQAVVAATKNGNEWGIKAAEVEMLGLGKDSAWNLFEDLTYGELMALHAKSQNRIDTNLERDWYQNYLPHPVRAELDSIYAALDKMSMVGPTNQLTKEDNKFHLDYENYQWLRDENRIRTVKSELSYKIMADRVNAILDRKVDPKKTNINYDIFDAHINSSKAYKVYVEGAGGYPALSRSSVANMMFGSGIPDRGNWVEEQGGWDALTKDQQDMIEEGERLTKSHGPDIGLNPLTSEYVDYQRMYRGSYSDLMPDGALTSEDYRVTLVKTQGGSAPDMPSQGQHFGPNFMHIRQSVAEFQDAPTWADYDAANVKYANKAMLLGELQTDWSTKYRKGFSSLLQRDALDQRGQMLRTLLNAAHQQGSILTDRMVGDVGVRLADRMLAVMPDYTSATANEEAQQSMERNSSTRFNKPLAELTDAESKELWQLMYVKQNQLLQEKLSASLDLIQSYRAENEVSFKTMAGSLDARAFDKLDQYTANQFLHQVHSALLRVRHVVDRFSNPASVESSAQIKAAITEAADINRRGDQFDDEARLRLPWAMGRIKPVLVAALGPIGATEEQIEGVAAAFKERSTTVYTMPKDVLQNIYSAAKMDKFPARSRYNEAPEQGEQSNIAANRIFKEYWATNFVKTVDDDVAKATMVDAPVTFYFDGNTDSNVVAITVTGTPASVAIFEKYKDDVIEEYIRQMIPMNVLSVRENQSEDSGDDYWTKVRERWIDRNDLRSELDNKHSGIEYDATDPDEGERSELDDAGVSHKYDFIEDSDNRNTADEFLRSQFTENIDWDEEGLTEESDEYQAIINRDPDDEDGPGGVDAADMWLADARTAFEDANFERDDYQQEIDDEVESMWENTVDNTHAPYLYKAELPTEWDEDGDVTNYVEFKIQADDVGDSFYIWIDNDWKSYENTESEAWNKAQYTVADYFENEDLKPPAGEIMGPDNDQEVADRHAVLAARVGSPNLDVLASMSAGKIELKGEDKIDLVKGFKNMVEIDKKFGNRTTNDRNDYYKTFYPDSPMHKDALWRVTALRYLLSDAVRRGFGAIVWHDGLATATRGGGDIGNSDRVATKRIDWSKEIVMMGGKEEEVFVITTPGGEMRAPLVVNKQNMIQTLGIHAAGVMRQQADGTWEERADAKTPLLKLPFTPEELENQNNYVINEVVSEETGQTTYSVHDVAQGRFIGFFRSPEEAQQAVTRERDDNDEYYLEQTRTAIERATKPRGASARDRQSTESEAIIGKKLSQGVIFAEDIGGENIYLLPGDRVSRYAHTYGTPTLAGARFNYEQMTVDIWNKELKKYGAKIESSYIKTNNPRTAYRSEGQVGKVTSSVDDQWESTYGAVEIVSVNQPSKGFVVITQKGGPLSQIFTTYEKALNHISTMKDGMATNREGIKVFAIVLNDKIKETFVNPVAPFHYDKRLEQHLKTAKGKFKNRKIPLIQRARKFVERVRSGSFRHSAVDSRFGLLKALQETGKSDRSYMANRMTTGLEARVKAALYFGHPIWVEDTTQSAGKGLMEIFSGINGDPQLWGMYMAGLRGKELMLEGYDKLPIEKQTEIDVLVEKIEGDTTKEKLWNFLVANTKKEEVRTRNNYSLTAKDKTELGEAGAQFYDVSLYHFRANKEVLLDNGKPDPKFKGKLKFEWQKRIRRTGPVFDPRLNPSLLDSGETSWELKKQNMIWDLMDDPKIKKDGNYIYRLTGKPKPGRYSKYEKANYYGVETEVEAESIINAVIDKAVEKQAAEDAVQQVNEANRNKIGRHSPDNRMAAVNELVYQSGREKVFTEKELVALVELGEAYPSFERVRKEYAEFNSKVLDFVQEAGVINAESRKIWESEFYVPLYRVKDDRIGGPMAQNAGVTDLRKPIKRLTGDVVPRDPVARLVYFVSRGAGQSHHAHKMSERAFIKARQEALDAGYIEVIKNTGKKPDKAVATEKGRQLLLSQGTNVGDILDNIMMNMTALIDAAVKNHAALMAVDDLIDTGMIAKTPWKARPKTEGDKARINAAVLRAINDGGFNEDALPTGLREELGKLMDLDPPSGPGVIDVLRNGRREYYFTDNILLYESLTQVNHKNFNDNWLFLTLPKRFFTGTITLTPTFMATNVFRDSISASISGRDEFVPFIGAMKGFVSALSNDEVMRTMVSGGAAFEAGFITGGDERATAKMVEKAMVKSNIAHTIVNNKKKLAKLTLMLAWDSYTKLGSSLENANRVAVYKAARASGKSLLRSLYESKDIMDFSMRGNNTAMQFLAATVPFHNARLQGIYRTGRGIQERPVASLAKGALYMAAALGVWAMFREDERYKSLEDWDKATYHHYWIGENHFRLPRAFEVGALFTTIPEQWLDYMYSKEDDRGKQLIRQWAFMWGQTFSMNPIPHTAKPVVEMMRNYNFFTQRQIVSPFDQRMAQDQYGPRTSETMRELGKIMPDIDVGQGNISSPKHLENLYRGYTGTIGAYLLAITDAMVRSKMDYPLPPTKTPAQDWLTGRFVLGSNPPYRTKQAEEFYRMINKITDIQGSLSFYERTGVDDARWDEILDSEAPYINVADDVEDIREEVRELNREEMEINFDKKMTPDKKRELIDLINTDRNSLFNEAYKLRPGGVNNPNTPAESASLESLIKDFGINDSKFAERRLKEESPDTLEILQYVRDNMKKRELIALSKANAGE